MKFDWFCQNEQHFIFPRNEEEFYLKTNLRWNHIHAWPLTTYTGSHKFIVGQRGKGAPEINSVRNAILLMIVEGVLTALGGYQGSPRTRANETRPDKAARSERVCSALLVTAAATLRVFERAAPSPATQAAHNNIMALLTVISATSAQTCPPDVRSVCPGKKGFFLGHFRSSF